VSAIAAYPDGRAARDRFVLERRGPRPSLDPWASPRVVVDREPDLDGAGGGVVDVATLFLTGRECPWRCVMCDLWRHTIEGDTPIGAIEQQIAQGVARLDHAVRHIKLYNAGSYFDPRAVPPADDPGIARAVSRFDRVIVESHPALIGARTWAFRDRVASLEVAMGLETAHPEALARLNKGLTLDGFATAAAALAAHDVGLRVFLLVHPPFVPRDQRTAWIERSVDIAIAGGARVIALIPTRGGNGALEALAATGGGREAGVDALFESPSLIDLEAAAAAAMRRARGRARILADLWDLEAFTCCGACLDTRRARLLGLNLEQHVPGAIACAACGEVTPA
jgi:hypothetical protein